MTQTPPTTDNSTRQHPPLRVDLSYAVITLGTSILWAILSGWLVYFYMPPDGSPRVPVALYSVVTFISGTVLSAFITPPVGYWSDNARNRWGRRLPFMFASALPMLLFFVLLWMPPIAGQSIWNLVYLAVILALYNFTYVLNQVPYSALLPEVALTDPHRVRISAWTSGAMLIGVIASSLAGPAIKNIGYIGTALIYALCLLPLFYLPFLVLRERPNRQIAETDRLNFWQSIKLTLGNRPFQVLTAAGALYWCVTSFVQAVIPFIVTEICALTVADTVYFYIAAVAASLACYPVVIWLAGRLGKWRVFTGSLLAAAIVMPGLMLIGEWLPLPLFAQGLIWITLQSVAMSGAMMLPPAFAAEITDYDEELTGQRREGAYYSAWGLLDEVINSAALALLPLLLLLGRSRSDPYGPLGVRMVGVISGALLLAAFLIFLHYPLRHRQATEKTT